jgi:hypothetical protein
MKELRRSFRMLASEAVLCHGVDSVQCVIDLGGRLSLLRAHIAGAEL